MHNLILVITLTVMNIFIEGEGMGVEDAVLLPGDRNINL